MSDTSKTVFISYRRHVSSAQARSVYLDLKHHGFDVFMDVENIGPGEFGEIILRQIEAREHFIVILTPGSTERFEDKDDWLRKEIEFALKVKPNIVPIFVNNFKFGDYEDHFTGGLSQLLRLNGLKLDFELFEECMERLRVRFLTESAPVKRQRAPEKDQSIVEKIQQRTDSLPAPKPKELFLYNDAEDNFAEGELMSLHEDYSNAIRYFSEAIRLDPNYSDAYGMRGNARAKLGDFDAAIADFTRVIEIRPEDKLAYYNRGLAHSEKGQFDTAIADFTQVIEIDPMFAAGYIGRGYLYFAKAQFNSAYSDFRRAIDLGSDHGGMAGLAVTFHALGNVDEAHKLWRELVALDNSFSNPETFKNNGDWLDPLVEEARRLIAGLDEA